MSVYFSARGRGRKESRMLTGRDSRQQNMDLCDSKSGSERDSPDFPESESRTPATMSRRGTSQMEILKKLKIKIKQEANKNPTQGEY